MITALIDEMSVQLRPTWSKIIMLSETITSKRFTRQALSAHEQIADAYQNAIIRHRMLRNRGVSIEPKLPDDDIKSQKISTLEMTIHEQSELIDALQDMLVRYVGNAQNAGISQEKLEAPLEGRADWRSDIDAMADRTKEARRRQRQGRTAPNTSLASRPL